MTDNEFTKPDQTEPQSAEQQPQIPSVGKPQGEKEDAQATANQKEAERQQRVARVTVRRRRERRKRIAKTVLETVAALATVSIAILTAAYVYYSSKQWQTMEDTLSEVKAQSATAGAAVDAAKLSAEAAQAQAEALRAQLNTMRAKVLVTSVGDLKMTADSGPVQIEVENTGRMSATRIAIRAEAIPRERMEDGVWRELSRIYFPMVEHPFLGIGSRFVINVETPHLSSEFIQKMKARAAEVVIVGDIVFGDDVGLQTTPICWSFENTHGEDVLPHNRTVAGIVFTKPWWETAER